MKALIRISIVFWAMVARGYLPFAAWQLVVAGASFAFFASAQGRLQEPTQQGETTLIEVTEVPERMDAEPARRALERALAWIIAGQHPDGTWGVFVPTDLLELDFASESYYDWNLASNFLVLLALMECEETPERRAALERGMRAACEKRMTLRGDDWDNDQMWTALYATVSLTRAAEDERLRSEPLRSLIHERGRQYAEVLGRFQVIEGGWGYYDNPPFTHRPKSATSFSTACVVPALAKALELGWIEDPSLVQRAIRYVDRCRLPNGAYQYHLDPIASLQGGEHYNEVQGSLGRIQVCNWALATVGVGKITTDLLREGLNHFFEEHRFFDAARLRPVPHEAYFSNAGYYYFFGHYYAALVINLLPFAEREDLHARLRTHLVKAMRADGSCTDFLGAQYDVLASTAFLALALDAGLEKSSR